MSRETAPVTRLPTRYFVRRLLPRVLAHLAVRQADLARVLVELFDADLHLLADFQHFARMFHAVPAQLADVDQPVDAAQIDERAEILEAPHDAFADLAGSQFRHQLVALFVPFALHHGPMA